MASQSADSFSGSSSDGGEDVFFSVRTHQCEYYLAPLESLAQQHRDIYQPLVDDMQRDPRYRYRLPVVRIFGSTPMGQRACLHLHGFLPYLFVQPAATESEAVRQQWNDASYVEELLPQLEAQLETALHQKREENRQQQQQQPPQQQAQPQQQQYAPRRQQAPPWKLVHRAMVVRGKPLYGYHHTEQLFVKIWLLDPAAVQLAASVLLDSGIILGLRLQPHEAHINFALQLFADLNLVGMGYVHLSNFRGHVRFRPPLPRTADHQKELQEEEQQAGGRSSCLQDPMSVSVRFRLWLRGNTPEQYVQAGPGGGRSGGGGGVGGGEGGQLAQQQGGRGAEAKEGQAAMEQDREAAVAEVLDGLSWSQDLAWSQAPDRAGEAAVSEPRREEQGRGGAGKQDDEEEARAWKGRMSTCELELDAHVDDVMNRHLGRLEALRTGNCVNSLQELWDEEAARQQQAGGRAPTMSQLQAEAGEGRAARAMLENAEKALAQLLERGRAALRRRGREGAEGEEGLLPPAQMTGSSSSQGLSQASGGSQGSSSQRRMMSQERLEVAFTQAETARLQQVMSQAGEEQEAEARRRRKEQEVEEAAEDEAGEDAVRDLRNMEMTQQAENEAYRRHLDSTPTKSPANVRRGPGGSASGGKKRGRAGSPRREAEELLLQSESRRPRLSQEEGTASSGSLIGGSQSSGGRGSQPHSTAASGDSHSNSSSTATPPIPQRPVPLSAAALRSLRASDVAALRFHRRSPTASELQASLWGVYRLLPVLNPPLVFSHHPDLDAERSRHHHHHHPDDLLPFDTADTIAMAQRRLAGQPHQAPPEEGAVGCQRCKALALRRPIAVHGPRVLVPTRRPPSQSQVRAWLAQGGPEGKAVGRRRSRVRHSGDGGSSSEDESEEEGEEGAAVRFASNPQGVLGAGGRLAAGKEAKGAGGAGPAVVHLVADPNTGKLVPTTVVAQGSAAAAPSTTSMPPPGPVVKGRGAGGGGYVGKLTSQISPPTQTPLTHLPGSDEKGLRRIYPAPTRSAGSRVVRHSEGNRHTVLCLEVHVQTRKELRPDPRLDAVAALAYVVRDYRNWSSEHEDVANTTGVIVAKDALRLMVAPAPTQQQQPAATAVDGWCPVCKTKDRARFCACPKFATAGSSNSTTAAARPGSTAAPPAPPPLPTGGRGALSSSLVSGLSLGEGVEVAEVADERQLFEALLRLVRRFDPDFLVGWEVQQGSLGYLRDRHKVLHPEPTQQPSLIKLLSRLQPERERGVVHVGEEREDEWGEEQQSGIWVMGRTVLNVWRLMRSELKLSSYTLGNVVAHVLGRRFPDLRHSALTRDFARGPASRSRTLQHVLLRARLVLDLLDQLDLIGRTSEMARLFGIDFFSVLNRGSQYRVEAVLFRVLKPLNYIAISGSRNQVASQEALEYIPLVFEPRSGVYTEPVAVLDFQSLYPSMIIAYNLCFSTCLGRISPTACANTGTAVSHKGKLGLVPYPEARTAANLALIADEWGDEEALACFVSPSGALFCPPRTRAGVLPRMLHEILQTRFMVKKAMKHPANARRPVLQRVLNARQFALKMIANVTYGYASASFSGRMPMAELADAIVSTARRTLVSGVELVHRCPDWAPAEVVYGDTDSMFVCLRGRSTAGAIAAGREIAKRVTADNPHGVVLKFDKVYDSCVLASKKRYVGRAFEEEGGPGHFDAKGIEAVRRDQCPIVVKMQAKALRLLFATRDLSQVKAYVVRQLTKLLEGRVRLQDFIFAKEVRMGSYAQDPPAAIVAGKAMQADPRAEPRSGERVPYVVVTGPPVTRLSDNVVDPHRLMGRDADPGLRINFTYYIEKQVLPALNRVLLCDVDVRQWYHDMPRPAAPINSHHRGRQGPTVAVGGSMPITNYYPSIMCQYCRQTVVRLHSRAAATSSRAERQALTDAVCSDCLSDPSRAAAIAKARQSSTEARVDHLHRICQACCHAPSEPRVGDACVSLDCPVYFERCRADEKLRGDIEDLLQSVMPRGEEEEGGQPMQVGQQGAAGQVVVIEDD